MTDGILRSRLVPIEDVSAWPVAEIFPRDLPAEVDEGGARVCTILTVQESGPLEEGSGGAKSKRDVIMTEGDRARGCGKWLDESMFPQQNKVVASLSREA